MDNTILYTPTLYTKVEGEIVLKTVQEKHRQNWRILFLGGGASLPLPRAPFSFSLSHYFLPLLSWSRPPLAFFPLFVCISRAPPCLVGRVWRLSDALRHQPEVSLATSRGLAALGVSDDRWSWAALWLGFWSGLFGWRRQALVWWRCR